MVCKVINDSDAIHHGAHLKSSFDALKSDQGLLNCCEGNSLPGRQRRCSRCIQRVVFASHVQSQVREGHAFMLDLPPGLALSKMKVCDAPSCVWCKTIPLHFAKGTRHAFGDIRSTII